MPKIITFEGKQHSFPDDFTDADISAALTGPSTKEIGADVAKSAGVGVAKGGIGLAGLPGDIGELGAQGLDVAVTGVGKLIGQDWSRSPQARPLGESPIGGAAIQRGIESVTGKFYKPKTTYGEYAQTAGEFLPAAAAGPGGVARRTVVQALAPAMVSETAGQATKGTAAEPFARVAGALATPAALGGTARATRAVRNVDDAPPIAQLRQEADQLYRVADNSGVVVARDSLRNAVDDIRTAVADAGIDATLHPKALAAFRRLEAGAGENQSLRGMDILRRVAGGAAQSIDRDEARIARIIRDRLDDYMERLTPRDVLTGDAQVATGAITQARDLWGRMRKGEAIERLIERAGNRAGQFSGSGYENALRTEFRNLSQNERRLARFSPQEREAITAVARGGPVSNAFRALGRFAPRGVVSIALGGGIGYGAGGEQGAIALPVAGEIGRRIATVMTRNRARTASALTRRGGPAPRDLDLEGRRRLARLLALETSAQQARE